MAGSKNPSPGKREAFASFLTYGALGLEMGLCVAIGLALGLFLDSHFKTSPILTLVFFGFGLVAGMRALYRSWKQAEKESENEDKDPGGDAH